MEKSQIAGRFVLNPDGLGKLGCGYLTRAGEPCTAPAVKGLDPPACSGHSGRLTFDPKQASDASVRKRRERAERRKMSAADHLALELERNSVAVARRLLAVGLSDDWRALAFLFERVYGKSLERVETATTVEGLGIEELRALRAKLLAEHPELRQLKAV